MKEAVAIARTERNLARGVDTVVEHLGGWSSFAVKGETIVLKPNLVAPRHAKTGATTSLELLALVAERLKDLGAHPALLETPGMEYRVEETWRFFDLPALARSSGAKILPTDDKQWVSTKIPQARVLKKARLHRAVLEHRIFNLAKLKTHIITTATLSMKNLMGLCHDDTKRAMHILGVHRGIVDLNRLVQPTLNLIDGTVAMEGDGAVYGIPKKVGMLIAGKSALATDLVGLELMGLPLAMVRHLKCATEEFGTPEIEKNGDAFVAETFLAPKPSKAYLFGYRMLYLVDLCFHRFKGLHFNEYLYRKGIVGTRPYIIKSLCDSCGDCLATCPTPQCVDLSRKIINTAECLRCLDCVDVCSQKAIEIKGISGNKNV
jgi:uncharacterized protein (DUF362 family)/Pyruvate/2-oxoacid:ferredoxin oxidoreductase delta subunit